MNKFLHAAQYISMMLIGVLLNACSSSAVLIRQDDQVFAEAQQ